jgi:hypothetical protein
MGGCGSPPGSGNAAADLAGTAAPSTAAAMLAAGHPFLGRASQLLAVSYIIDASFLQLAP